MHDRERIDALQKLMDMARPISQDMIERLMEGEIERLQAERDAWKLAAWDLYRQNYFLKRYNKRRKRQ